ncbi:MAG: PadR family transcriptional regulator [Chloroflexota bacterium]
MSSLTPDDTLLGLLAANARHGYQLMDCFRDPAQLGEVWNLSTSQLYAVLKRLSAQGFITGSEITSENAPTRTEYTLTPAGKKRLESWLHEACPSASIRAVRVEFLSRLFVARVLNIPTIPIVRAQKTVCNLKRTELGEQCKLMEPGIGFLALELVIAQLDAVLQWIDRCELVTKDLEDD